MRILQGVGRWLFKIVFKSLPLVSLMKRVKKTIPKPDPIAQINKQPFSSIISIRNGNALINQKEMTLNETPPNVTPIDRIDVGKVSIKHKIARGLTPTAAIKTTNAIEITGTMWKADVSMPLSFKYKYITIVVWPIMQPKQDKMSKNFLPVLSTSCNVNQLPSIWEIASETVDISTDKCVPDFSIIVLP